MQNNIQLIETFISDQKSTKLLINYVNDELIEFYYGVVKFLCIKNKLQTKYFEVDTNVLSNTNDLFQKTKVLTSKLTNTKKIEIELFNNNKSIIFIDYKNYKKFKINYLAINGYDFEKDIKFFLNKILKFNDNDLTNFCTLYPAYLFSEISKYEINKDYVADKILSLKIDNLLSIRKSIYDQKKTNKDLKGLYKNIKDEAKIKKFNFLTY